jgi:4-diphosphocytidyl-2-C-methyl-D-erythritol kinase
VTGTRVTVRVPAKVNLHLSVGPLRKDGFHELVTVYHAISLYDEVVVSPGDGLQVTVVGEGSGELPVDDDNLAVRAVRAVAAVLGRPADITVAVRKGIPVAGGLAGGSADAAAALVAADALWGGELDRITLEGLAAGIGSDVAFLLHGGSALGTGRGEAISPVLGTGDYHWVLAVADVGLSTPKVYAELDRMRDAGPTPRAGEPDGVLSALRAGDVVALGTVLANDLQAASMRLRPQLRQVLEAGRELGATGAIVSGSGPTVALLARTAEDSVRIASSLSGMDLCRTVRRAPGPVPGARDVADDADR